jgi:SSS family solute:Na+ symporter
MENPMGIGWFGMVAGLGFVLSFGYWCTDFLVVQRAMAANSMSAARRTPLIAAVPKMLFPALVILPGMIAIAMHHADGGKFLPLAADGTPDYNMTIPDMLAKYFPSGLLGIGFTALMASFMSGHGGQCHRIQYGLDLRHLPELHRQGKSDHHYLWMGRWATVFGILVSIGVAARVEVQ